MASGSSMLLFSRSSEDQAVREQEIRASPAAAVPPKKQRNRPAGMPYPDAEVIALSPTTLMAKNRFVCEICYKGFPREQNLQLHKRGHNLPWKLKQRTTKDEVKRKVYLCPDPSCVHHDPSRALGDLTGIKKHYSRKHGDKKYKCQNCEKMYAVQSDLKAHSKTCGKKEYKCHCGTLFSRRDSFISHRAFCEALAEGGLIRHTSTVTSISSTKITDNKNYPSLMSASLPKLSSQLVPSIQNLTHTIPAGVSQIGQTSHTIRPSNGFNCYKPTPSFFVPSADQYKYQGNSGTRFFTNLVNTPNHNMDHYNLNFMGTSRNNGYCEGSSFSSSYAVCMPQLSATGLLQKAALIGSTSSNNNATNFAPTSSSSDPVDGTMFEKGGFCFGNSDANEHGNNMNELLNSFSGSIVESTILSRYSGATYAQEDSNHGGLDSTSREYDHDIWKSWNSEELRQQPPQNIGSNMHFQQSSGVTFTRDFLGVGGEIVGNISSDIQQCTFGGRGFL